MFRFIHVGFHTSLYPHFETLKSAFTQLGGDWIKYSQGGWILWTDRSVDHIYNIIKPLVGPNDQFIIAPIVLTEKQGWMPQWIWDWINNKISSPTSQLPRMYGDNPLGLP